MEVRGRGADRHGRNWTATIISESEAGEADFRFWYEGLPSEERVDARFRDYEEFIASLNRSGAERG